MKKIKLMAIITCISATSFAQDSKKVKGNLRTNNFADLSVGSNGKDNLLTLSVGHVSGLGSRKQWRLGYGARFSSFNNSDNKNYVSAIPSMYQKTEKMDTMVINKVAQSNLVAFISANYRIKSKIEVGFNIDLAGYSFARSRSVDFISEGITIKTTAKGNAPSALLVGANDLGMLKSEFNIGYQINPKWMMRFGINSLLTEYATNSELQPGNTRYRGTGMIPFLSIRFAPQTY
jgi:hypothetical protein